MCLSCQTIRALYIPQVFLTSLYISATQSFQGVHTRSCIHSLFIPVVKLAHLVSARLLILRSSVRFRQNLTKLRTQIYMDLCNINLKQGLKFTVSSHKSNYQSMEDKGGGFQVVYSERRFGSEPRIVQLRSLNTDNVNFCTWSRPYQREASRPSGPG